MDPKPGPKIHYTTAGFVLAAFVIITVAVVVPEAGAAAARDARASALAGANAIGVALRQADADVGCVRRAEPGAPAWMFGPGVMPRGIELPSAKGFPLSGILASDRAKSGAAWRGPYLDQVPMDPWGRAYVVLIDPARRAGPIIVLSAGKDGILDTKPGAGAIAGDDVGIVVAP